MYPNNNNSLEIWLCKHVNFLDTLHLLFCIVDVAINLLLHVFHDKTEN